jgi:cytochrome P450
MTDQQSSAPGSADVLSHLDIYDAGLSAILDETLEHARTHCPVSRSDANGGYHLVSRYEDVTAVLGDDAQFSSKGGKSLPPRQLLEMPPLDCDPPEQRGYRRLLNPFFSRRGLARHEPAIREIARGLIDGFIGSGRFEMVEDFASPLTAATLCRVILNLDDDELMATARQRVVAIGAGNTAQAWVELTEFLTKLIRERKPAGDGHVLDAILSGAIDGTPLTDEQKLGIIIVLFLGGMDTTRAQIACIAHHLAVYPELEQRLRNPQWVRADLDEFLRHDSVVTALARKVTAATELNGVALGAGDRLLIHYYSANHDTEQFEHPGELVFDRRRNPHVAFGLGVHRCLGSNLARLQIQAAFDELLARVTNLRIAPGARIKLSSGVTRMPESLPLVFDRVSA